MKEIYIKYNNEEEFNKLQDILLDLNYKWTFSGEDNIEYMLNYNCVILNNNSIILSKIYKFNSNKIIIDVNKEDIKSYIEAMKMGLL